MSVRGNERAAEACGLGDREPGVRLCRFDDDAFGDAGAHYWDSRTGDRLRAEEVEQAYTPEQPCPEHAPDLYGAERP